jgi:hypothetical protein
LPQLPRKLLQADHRQQAKKSPVPFFAFMRSNQRLGVHARTAGNQSRRRPEILIFLSL